MNIKQGKNVKAMVRHRMVEALNYFHNSLGSSSPDNVRLLIFGQGRSGSTLLESLITSTGHFSQHGELLNTDRGEIIYPVQYISGLSKRKASENIVFHAKVYHLTRDRKRPVDPAEFLNTLYKDGWKIIYLLRKNKVKHALSNVVAQHRGSYHKYDDKKESFSLTLDCDEFINRVNERFIFEDIERNALEKVPYLEVTYEDDLENSDNHQATINRILDYLSLESRDVSTKIRKVNTQPLKDLIVNYDEFVDCLKENKWEKFL